MAAPIKLSSRPTGEFWEIPVLFEDEHLLAVDKPARLLVSPDRYDPARPNLMGLLHAGIKAGAPWAVSRGLGYLSNAHRLDFETTGILLLAKSKPVLVALANAFGCEKPSKTYLALAHGVPAEPEFSVDAKLAPDDRRPGTVRIDRKHGKKSLTHFRLVEAFRDQCLLHCFPQTGRTHQIRVHLRHQRLPILGDVTYGGRPLLLSSLKRKYRQKENREEIPLMGRVALHAAGLELPHPVTGATVTITSPWPKDFLVSLKYLRRYAAVGAPLTASADPSLPPPAGDEEEGAESAEPTGGA